MKKLFEEFKIRNTTIKNRVCVPPAVCFGFSDDTGYVTQKNINHYNEYAKGGFGLVIIEATAIDKNGRLSFDQLGIFEDGQIEGHKKIAELFKDSTVVLQIHHAGVMSPCEDLVSSYEYTLKDKAARKLSLKEVKEMEEKYILAAIRAYKAGYNGVELHGAHNYLLTQFLNERVNKRDDEYGKDKTLIVKNILKEIRKNTSKDFIVGIRMGVFEPTIDHGIKHAKIFEEIGIDFLNVSSGFSFEADAIKPENFEFKDVIYGAGEIKKNVSIPVFAVNGINSKQDAQKVLEITDVDMVCLCRATLVNQNWANDAKEDKYTGKCLYCPKCYWRNQIKVCPGKVLYQKNK